MKPLIVQTLKPRNPLVAASHRRLAGAHTRSRGGVRQQQRQAVRHELRQMSLLHKQRQSP